MATANEIHKKSECLLQEIGVWKSTIAAYTGLFGKDAVTKEFIAFKIDIAEGLIEEYYSWEKLGNESKCKYALDNAEFFLGQIQVLFDSMFIDEHQETRQEIKEVSLAIFYTPVS